MTLSNVLMHNDVANDAIMYHGSKVPCFRSFFAEAQDHTEPACRLSH